MEENNVRIEKKFILGKHKKDTLEKLLLTNGFKKLYPDRIINSIYIDTLGYDFAKDNIRVVAINPGAIDTPMVRNAILGTGGDLEIELDKTAEAHPIGRIGQGKDIANAVLFLASDKASFITGEYLNVDGGMMAFGAWGATVGSAGSN